MIESVGEYILLKPEKMPETRNGLILQKTKKEYDLCEVVSGNENDFKKGERVFTFLHCGNEIEYENEKYFLVHKDYIHGKLLG